MVRGGAKTRQTILIHSGASAVGQAAIRIALGIGLKVITTARTEQKREFIRLNFPTV